MATSALEFFDALQRAGVLRGTTWASWRTVLCVLFGVELTDNEAELFHRCTCRTTIPTEGFNEAWFVCGRRSGKSFMLALIGVFLAIFRDYRPYLGPGERAHVALIATDRKQARTMRRFVGGLLRHPLAQRVTREWADGLDLKGGVTIEVHTASFRTTRGYTLAAALMDEVAFWPTDDAAEPDYAVLDALRPGMATIPNSMLLCASSPYARRGALWDAHRRYYGRNDAPVLVWKAPTRLMNPTVPQSVIDRAMERDPSSARAEYLAEFRDDVESFVSRVAIEACVPIGVAERGPRPDVWYIAFCDPSGGAHDAMTLAIAHREGDVAILDALREVRPPFSPEAVVRDFCAALRSYRCSTVRGDRYAGEWPRERFAVHGIDYRPSDKSKSEIYGSALSMINSRRVDLLDHAPLVAQFCGLERRTGRGRDAIDHAPGQHDDLCNAAAGALVEAGAGDVVAAWGEIYAARAARASAEAEQQTLPALPWHQTLKKEPQQPASGTALADAEQEGLRMYEAYVRTVRGFGSAAGGDGRCAACGELLIQGQPVTVLGGFERLHPDCLPLFGQALKARQATSTATTTTGG
jgi:hypothetical protein